MDKPTQELLKSVLNYDPDSGEFNWIVDCEKFKRKKGQSSIKIEKDYCTKKKLSRKYVPMPELGYKKRFSATSCAILFMTGIWAEVSTYRIFYKDGNPLNLKWENLGFFKKEYPITQDYLKKLLTYSPQTGIFKWKYDTFSKKGGSKSRSGYVYLEIDSRSYSAHRLAWLYMTGELPPEHLEIDHINRIRHDNRWENLRVVTPSENVKNSSNNPIMDEIYFSTADRIWKVIICVDGKRTFIGSFDDVVDAAIAYKKKKEEISLPLAID